MGGRGFPLEGMRVRQGGGPSPILASLVISMTIFRRTNGLYPDTFLLEAEDAVFAVHENLKPSDEFSAIKMRFHVIKHRNRYRQRGVQFLRLEKNRLPAFQENPVPVEFTWRVALQVNHGLFDPCLCSRTHRRRRNDRLVCTPPRKKAAPEEAGNQHKETPALRVRHQRSGFILQIQRGSSLRTPDIRGRYRVFSRLFLRFPASYGAQAASLYRCTPQRRTVSRSSVWKPSPSTSRPIRITSTRPANTLSV